LKTATKKLLCRESWGIFYFFGHHPDPYGGYTAKIGELACMSPNRYICGNFDWPIRAIPLKLVGEELVFFGEGI